MKKIFFAALALAASMSTMAQSSLKDAPTTFSAGAWKVLRDTDRMTDKVTCTGMLKSDPSVQASDTGLYIRIVGGIESVQLRFDSEPPQDMRLPTRLEKDVRAIIITGADFEKALASKRLRYQSLLLIRGMKEGEVSLEGLPEAVEHIKAGCPQQADRPEKTQGTKAALGKHHA